MPCMARNSSSNVIKHLETPGDTPIENIAAEQHELDVGDILRDANTKQHTNKSDENKITGGRKKYLRNQTRDHTLGLQGRV